MSLEFGTYRPRECSECHSRIWFDHYETKEWHHVNEPTEKHEIKPHRLIAEEYKSLGSVECQRCGVRKDDHLFGSIDCDRFIWPVED